jgi:hypothetical protein
MNDRVLSLTSGTPLPNFPLQQYDCNIINILILYYNIILEKYLENKSFLSSVETEVKGRKKCL